MKRKPGTYILIYQCFSAVSVHVGRLGILDLPAGYYFCMSAVPSGLEEWRLGFPDIVGAINPSIGISIIVGLTSSHSVRGIVMIEFPMNIGGRHFLGNKEASPQSRVSDVVVVPVIPISSIPLVNQNFLAFLGSSVEG